MYLLEAHAFLFLFLKRMMIFLQLLVNTEWPHHGAHYLKAPSSSFYMIACFALLCFALLCFIHSFIHSQWQHYPKARQTLKESNNVTMEYGPNSTSEPIEPSWVMSCSVIVITIARICLRVQGLGFTFRVQGLNPKPRYTFPCLGQNTFPCLEQKTLTNILLCLFKNILFF